MPAVAMWGGVRVESWSLSVDEWLVLRDTYRETGLTMTCGEPGVPVEMQGSGTKFFRHKGESCGLHEGGPESAEHLRTKALVAEIAQSLGWTALIEEPAPDRLWIADVLLKKGDVQLAIEVQWAAQSEQEFRSRTERYERNGVLWRWLIGPKNHDRTLTVSATAVAGTHEALTIAVPTGLGGSKHVPMEDGLRILLNGSLQSRFEAVVDEVEVGTAMGKCYNPTCKAWFSYWFIRKVGVESRCGLRGTIGFAQRYPLHVIDRPETLLKSQVVRAINQSDLPNATRYKSTFSKTTNQRYTAQICPRCNWHQGDGFIAGNPPRWASYTIPITPTRIPLNPAVTAVQHQCVDQGRGRCVQDTPAGPSYPSDDWMPAYLPPLAAQPGRIDADPLPPRKVQRSSVPSRV